MVDFTNKQAYELHNVLKHPYTKIAKFFDVTKGKVAGKIGRYNPDEIEDDESPPESIQYLQDRTRILEMGMKVVEAKDKTREEICEMLGYPAKEWHVKDLKMTLWTGQRSHKLGGGVEPLYAIKLHIEPRTDFSVSIIDKYFSTKSAVHKWKVNKPRGSGGDLVLELNFNDLHIYVEAYHKDAPTAEERVRFVVGEAVGRCKGLDIGTIVLNLGGDGLHFDNRNRTTAAGTPLTTRGNYEDMFNHAMDLFIWAILELSKIAPVDVICTRGNHDENSGFAIAQSLKYRFAENKHVSIDAKDEPRKWRLFGKVLIGWTHHMAKARRAKWLHVEASEAWGKSKFREIHSEHLHMEYLEEDNGLKYRILSTTAPSDEWHHDKGYNGTVKCAMAFLWHKESGLQNIWYLNT